LKKASLNSWSYCHSNPPHSHADAAADPASAHMINKENKKKWKYFRVD
jgi:hypothetical protein